MVKISRRDFLKASSLAAMLSALNWPALVKAAGETIRDGTINVVWLEAQDCAGNTTAVIQATDPSLLDVLLGTTPLVGPGTVRLIFHETVMPQWGAFHVQSAADVSNEAALEQYAASQPPPGNADAILADIANGKYGPYVLVLEGSFPQEYGIQGSNITTAGGYYCAIGQHTCTEWLKRLLSNALAVVAVGNCASYGGIPANKVLEPPPGFNYATWSQSPTGAIGFFDDPLRGIKGVIHQPYFQPEVEPFRKYIDEGGVPDFNTVKPAIAVPGCPANGNGIMRTLALLVLVAAGYLDPKVLDRKAFLDEYARPYFIFGPTVHEQCPRAAWYAAGDFRPYPGAGDAKCLYAVGCKGPVAHCPWNKVGWVAGVGGPTRTGGVCIACTNPGFTDAYEPFYAKLPYVGVSLEDLKNIAVGVGGAIAVAGVAAAAWTAARSAAIKKGGQQQKGEEKKS
ncbi:MAG: hyaluronate lyase [Thermoproteus sp.]